MSLPDYQIVMLDPATGKLVTMLDGSAFYQLRYSRVMNDIGALAITLPSERAGAELDVLDLIIEVKRTSPVTGLLVTEETYLSRVFHRYREGDEERVTIGAFSLNHLLSRRVIDVADDPLEAGGYSTKAGPTDLILYEYAVQQIAQQASEPRRMPGLSVRSVLGVAESAGARLRYENLFDVFQQYSKQADIQFHIARTTGANMELSIGFLGVDRTQTTNYPSAPFVLLNPIRGNLSDPSIRRDRKDEGNFVYLQGKGQGGNRTLLTYFSNTLSDSPFNRIEYSEDARQVEKGDSLGLLSQAANSLKEHEALIEFEFSPGGSEPGNVYRLDWDVNDKLTASWEGISVDVRVVSVEINISASGEQMNITTEVI